MTVFSRGISHFETAYSLLENSAWKNQRILNRTNLSKHIFNRRKKKNQIFIQAIRFTFALPKENLDSLCFASWMMRLYTPLRSTCCTSGSNDANDHRMKHLDSEFCQEIESHLWTKPPNPHGMPLFAANHAPRTFYRIHDKWESVAEVWGVHKKIIYQSFGCKNLNWSFLLHNSNAAICAKFPVQPLHRSNNHHEIMSSNWQAQNDYLLL